MNRLEDKRSWLAGGSVLGLLIVAIGWFVFIGPQLSSAKSLRAQAAAAQTENSVLAAKVAKLKKQNDSVGQLQATLRDALAGLPFDTGLPAFTRQVSGQATSSGVSLTSITVGTSPGGTPAGGTPAGGTPAGGTPAAPTPNSTTAGTGTTGTSTTGTGTGTGSTSAAVMTIPITLLSKGSAKAQLAFLNAIQVSGPRRALVTSTTLSGTTSGSASIDKAGTMTTQVNLFTAPLSAAARAQLTKLLASK